MDELLIFSETTISGGHKAAVEHLTTLDRKAIRFDESIPPQLEGAKVLSPVMVFKEGDYVTLRRNGTPVPFKADRNRMEAWLRNTLRDSPVNYDHKRTDGPNTTGWLRVSTGNAYLETDPRDGKLALWAQPELGEEALGHVQAGRYRDMSIEIDPQTETIVGLALTNYPRVKNITQFSEGEDMPVDETPKTEPVVETTEVPAGPSTEEFNELKGLLAEAQALLKQQAEKAAADLAAAEAEAAKLRKEAQTAEFSEWVQSNLILDADGNSAIPVAKKDAVVELMLFAANADEGTMLFSETENAASPLDTLKDLLGAITKTQLVGEAAPAGLAPKVPEAEAFGLVEYVKRTGKKRQ